MSYLGDKSKIVKYCSVQTLGVLGKERSSKEEIAKSVRALSGDSKSLAKAVAKALHDLGVE